MDTASGGTFVISSKPEWRCSKPLATTSYMDVYHDREGVRKGPLTGNDKEALSIVAYLGTRFSPIVVFSDSVLPDTIEVGPLLKFGDKSGGNAELPSMTSPLLKSGIPSASRQLAR